jgi:hypothetical protein
VTPLYSILLDIKVVRIILILIGVIGIAVIYRLSRKKEIAPNKAKSPLLLLNLESKASDSRAESPLADSPEKISAPPSEPTAQTPIFKSCQQRSGMLSDLFRAFLVLLSLIVAAEFVLVLMSQSAIDRMAQDLRSRNGMIPQERIALLFLGDEIKDDKFQVLGEIRNISNAPIERLDAAIRFYSSTGGILETDLVRMDKELIAPDEKAQFRVAYPNYKKEFSRYAVEFKLRQGELLACKDLRAPRQ